MGVRRVDPVRAERLLGLIAGGMSPYRAAGIAGVPATSAYRLDREANVGARL